MNTLATTQGIQLLNNKEKWFIAEVVEDNHILHELNKNNAHLLFNDYVGQVVASVTNKEIKPELNFDLIEEKER